MFDVKEKIDELSKKINSDKGLALKFVKSPVKTIEEMLGVDLPDETMKKLLAGLKEKISLEKIGAMFDSDGDGKPDLGILSKFLGK